MRRKKAPACAGAFFDWNLAIRPRVLLRATLIVVAAGAIRNPGGRLLVVLEAGRRFELVLGDVHRQADLVILLSFLDRLELDGDVLFAGAQKAADADDQCIDLAV